MEQNIIQIGNSSGLIIPKDVLEKLGLSAGSQVEIQEDPKNGAIIITKKGKKYTSLTPEFFHQLEEINEEYGPALKALAEK
jgi:putative addiction module antidote